jgi:hypothetical protein
MHWWARPHSLVLLAQLQILPWCHQQSQRQQWSLLLVLVLQSAPWCCQQH